MEGRFDDAAYSARLEVAQRRRFRPHVANALRTVKNPNFLRGTLTRTVVSGLVSTWIAVNQNHFTGMRRVWPGCRGGPKLGTLYRLLGVRCWGNPIR